MDDKTLKKLLIIVGITAIAFMVTRIAVAAVPPIQKSSGGLNFQSKADLENISKKDLVAYFESDKRTPDGLIDKKLLKYREVINSASNIDEAKATTRKRFDYQAKRSKNSTSLEFEERDYYATLFQHDNKEGSRQFYNYCISFKKEAVNIEIFTRDKDRLDWIRPAKIQFVRKDPKFIKNVLDIFFYVANNSYGGFKILGSYIEEDNDKVWYEYYFTTHTGGDWGMRDMVGLNKQSVVVEKTTGIATFEDEKIVIEKFEYGEKKPF
ncbi:MAG: hypothetical protein LBC09_03890 [Helicobacteraceae bacterium]|jgi:hypothetical protein|nr:hypothetical protein [Helicobacteraceae bacterium]